MKFVATLPSSFSLMLAPPKPWNYRRTIAQQIFNPTIATSGSRVCIWIAKRISARDADSPATYRAAALAVPWAWWPARVQVGSALVRNFRDCASRVTQIIWRENLRIGISNVMCSRDVLLKRGCDVYGRGRPFKIPSHFPKGFTLLPNGSAILPAVSPASTTACQVHTPPEW